MGINKQFADLYGLTLEEATKILTREGYKTRVIVENGRRVDVIPDRHDLFRANLTIENGRVTRAFPG